MTDFKHEWSKQFLLLSSLLSSLHSLLNKKKVQGLIYLLNTDWSKAHGKYCSERRVYNKIYIPSQAICYKCQSGTGTIDS